MPLTSPRAMFERAYKEGYAIGAFNVNNMEIIQESWRQEPRKSPAHPSGFRRSPQICGTELYCEAH